MKKYNRKAILVRSLKDLEELLLLARAEGLTIEAESESGVTFTAEDMFDNWQDEINEDMEHIYVFINRNTLYWAAMSRNMDLPTLFFYGATNYGLDFAENVLDTDRIERMLVEDEGYTYAQATREINEGFNFVKNKLVEFVNGVFLDFKDFENPRWYIQEGRFTEPNVNSRFIYESTDTHRGDLKDTLKLRFEENYPGKRLLAIQLNGFSHTIFYDNGNKHDNIQIDRYSEYTRPNEMYVSDGARAVLEGIGHMQYKGNAVEYIYTMPEDR